jgi:hypothetical protein
MHTALIILVWVVNLGISVWNAYAAGKAWVETRHSGGWPRFMVWMGALMSASGFSWCYLIILVAAAHGLGYLDNDDVALGLRLGYILLIPGILVSGLMITIDSWARSYRTRMLVDIGRAAWNTYAQIHNTFHAIGNFDAAFGSVVDSFKSKGGSSSGSDKKDGLVAFLVVFVLVVLALMAGALTTAVIIARAAGNEELPDPSYGGHLTRGKK